MPPLVAAALSTAIGRGLPGLRHRAHPLGMGTKSRERLKLGMVRPVNIYNLDLPFRTNKRDALSFPLPTRDRRCSAHPVFSAPSS
jgi:hypothetical protein